MSYGDTRYEKIVSKMDMTQLIHDAWIDSFVHHVVLQHQYMIKLEKYRSSCFHTRLHMLYSVPNYNTLIFVEQGSHTHGYM